MPIVNLEQKAKVFILYSRNFFLFCRDVLGYKDMNSEHEKLCSFLQEPGYVKLILKPRYSFKSCICTIGFSLWQLSLKDSFRILIYSHSSEKAEGFLTGIKNHILHLDLKSKFREIYGNWEVDPKRGVWNQTSIVIKPRQFAYSEPSVDTAGIESGKVGMHYDLIIFDDIVSKENVTTKEQMDKVYECYQAALSLLVPGGQVLIVGTRWHFGDLYGRLLLNPPQGMKTFIRKAEENGKFLFDNIGEHSLTKEFLDQQKATQGSYLYSCLYQNSPTDSETAIFKPSDFRFYNPGNREWRNTLYITAVLDPIPPPTSDHGDDAAITVVGTDSENCMFILDLIAGRLDPEDQINELLLLHDIWKFRKVGIETNAFQRMIKSALENRLMELRKNKNWQPFSIVEFSGITQGNKEQRIQGLQPWHERGLLRFPGEKLELLNGVWSQLAYQMLEFPHSAKDDLLDSLAYHLQLKQPGTKTPILEEIPFSSAAWYEREWYKKEMKVLQRRPRWKRQIPQLAFS